MKSILLVFTLFLVLTNTCIFKSLLGFTGSSPHAELEQAFTEFEEVLSQTSAQANQETTWNSIVKTKYAKLPPTAGSGLEGGFSAVASFMTEQMEVSVTRTEDTMPQGRVRWIHPLGSCGKVKFVYNEVSQRYSGLFKGADYGIARFSLAGPPSGGYKPGMGLKFFRNNQISGNIISMFSLEGQGDNANFFQNTFSNIVFMPSGSEGFKLQLLAFLTFRRASSCPTVLSLGDFARFDQNGQRPRETGLQYPKQIYFQPVPETQFNTKANGRDFRDDLNTIKAGQRLYQVFVSDQVKGAKQKIGELIADSEFVSSDYCDTKIFFKHNWGEDINCGN